MCGFLASCSLTAPFPRAVRRTVCEFDSMRTTEERNTPGERPWHALLMLLWLLSDVCVRHVYVADEQCQCHLSVPEVRCRAVLALTSLVQMSS